MLRTREPRERERERERPFHVVKKKFRAPPPPPSLFLDASVARARTHVCMCVGRSSRYNARYFSLGTNCFSIIHAWSRTRASIFIGVERDRESERECVACVCEREKVRLGWEIITLIKETFFIGGWFIGFAKELFRLRCTYNIARLDAWFVRVGANLGEAMSR